MVLSHKVRLNRTKAFLFHVAERICHSLYHVLTLSVGEQVTHMCDVLQETPFRVTTKPGPVRVPVLESGEHFILLSLHRLTTRGPEACAKARSTGCTQHCQPLNVPSLIPCGGSCCTWHTSRTACRHARFGTIGPNVARHCGEEPSTKDYMWRHRWERARSVYLLHFRDILGHHEGEEHCELLGPSSDVAVHPFHQAGTL